MIVLHACCHNLTGADLTEAQWAEVVKACASRGLIPSRHGYQGLSPTASSPTPWRGQPVRRLRRPVVLRVQLFSKSFSLYGERVGACPSSPQNKDESARVLSQLKRVIRTNYSNPPIHGGAIVSACCPPGPARQWKPTRRHA